MTKFVRGEAVSFVLKGQSMVGIVIAGKTMQGGKVAVRNVQTGFTCNVPVRNIKSKFASLIG